jgi:hypothetical protein
MEWMNNRPSIILWLLHSKVVNKMNRKISGTHILVDREINTLVYDVVSIREQLLTLRTIFLPPLSRFKNVSSLGPWR